MKPALVKPAHNLIGLIPTKSSNQVRMKKSNYSQKFRCRSTVTEEYSTEVGWFLHSNSVQILGGN